MKSEIVVSSSILFRRIAFQPDKEIVDFLYELLEARRHPISHSDMPSMEEHKCFIANNPYRAWYVVESSDMKIGSVYFGVDNSVGFHLLPAFEHFTLQVLVELEKCFSPLPAQKSKVCETFFFNISPENQIMTEALENLGYRITQVSFGR